jgi:hypothetical protein
MNESNSTPNDVVDVATEEQLDRCIAIAAKIRTSVGSMLEHWWSVGEVIEAVILDQTGGAGALYGGSAIERIAKLSHQGVSSLYKAHGVFKKYTKEQISDLVAAGVYYGNLVAASSIPDESRRMQLLIAHGGAGSDEPIGTREFKDIVAKEAPPEAPAAGGTQSNQGAGSRPGTGPEKSPIGIVKGVTGAAEKLVDRVTEAVIAIKEFESDSDKRATKMVDQCVLAAGAISDLVGGLVGLVETLETHLANSLLSAEDRGSQRARIEVYSQASTALMAFLNGAPAMLEAGERLVAGEDDEPTEGKAAKAAKPPKAPKAPKPPKAPKAPKAPKPPKVAKEAPKKGAPLLTPATYRAELNAKAEAAKQKASKDKAAKDAAQE